MNKRILIHQPGQFGDIVICLPIAYWYFRQGSTVDWLCPRKFHGLFRNIDYCTPVESHQGVYDQVIDLSFGIIRGTSVDEWWTETRSRWQSFINAKYYLAGIPVYERWQIRWERNEKREDALYKMIVAKHGADYILCHEQSGTRVNIPINPETSNMPNLPRVIFEPIEDYNVFDWYKVVLEAFEVRCIDSALCNFVEVIPQCAGKRKHYYDKSRDRGWNKTILANNWNIWRSRA